MRKARINDLENINNIVNDAKISLKIDGVDQWQCGSPDLSLLQRQIEKSNAYVYGDASLAAYAYLSEDNEPTYGPIKALMKGEDYYTIHTFCVSSRQKGKGVGTKFFGEIIELARENGKDSLYIDTHEDNLKMQGLIKKMGFSYIGAIYILDKDIKKKRLAYELIL